MYCINQAISKKLKGRVLSETRNTRKGRALKVYIDKSPSVRFAYEFTVGNVIGKWEFLMGQKSLAQLV